MNNSPLLTAFRVARPSILGMLCVLLLTLTATAQQMPQDNWRYDGLQFSSPVPANQLSSIAIGSGGVYVGEVFSGSNPNRVLQFTEAGVFTRRFTDTFGYILGIACDAAGNVYVLDRTSSNVKMYDASGNFIRQWGSAGSADGQFSLATATGNTMISVSGKTSEIFVCDPGNTRVQVFNSSGTFLRKWGQVGSLPGQFASGNPSVIAVSDANRVFVGSNTGSGNQTVIRAFDTNGGYVSTVNGNSSYVYSLAIARDGILATTYLPNNGVDNSILDPSRSFQRIGYIPFYCSQGVAFSAKGHVYGVSGARFQIAYREYANAVNFTAPTAIPHPQVLASSQRAGTNLIDVDYQVTDADSATVTTALLAVRDNDDNVRIGNSVGMRTFLEGTAGNVGANQPTGVTRHVTWNMPADWAVDYATIQVEALAKDSRNLLGIHWITVPASGGQPAFQVSSAPVTDAMLHDAWLWFMANGQVTTAYTYNPSYGWFGTANGSSGAYTGVRLSYDEYNYNYGIRNVSTSAGRLFATEQMGARPITASEKSRAQAGRFGFSSVDDNSIVKVSGTPTSYLKGWGQSGYGQANWQSFPAPNVSAIIAGGDCTFLIRADGTLWAAGYNGYGQLGNGNTNTTSALVQTATGVAQVATSGYHTLFVKTDGTLWAMGNNDYGQLGDGTTTSRITPVQIATGVNQVAAGGGSQGFSLFIKTDGTLWATGYNAYGQLGDTTTTTRNTPVQISTGVAQVSAGAAHSMFVTTGGTLKAMGYNGYGQLGDGTTTQRTTPATIITGVQQASCGGASTSTEFSLFVKTNGTLWATGYNQEGELGDGTSTNRSTPVQVATGVAQASAGGQHSVFRKTDNTVWSMGYNGYGELGDGTNTQRNTPVQFDTNASGIAAGAYHTVDFTIP